MSRAVCGYYGKLPISPEFLRLHASGPEIRWLDEWLQRGTLYAKSQEGAEWRARVAAAKPYSFFYVPGREGRVVSGVLMASLDKAGRAFPFLSFALLDRDLFVSSPWLIPVATALFLGETTGSIRRLRADLDWTVFRHEVERRQVQDLDPASARDGLNQFVLSTTIGEWWAGGTTSFDGAKPAAIVEMVKRVAPTLPPHEQGIRFPILPGQTSSNLDLSFWLKLCLEHAEGAWHPHTGLLCLWSREIKKEGAAVLSIGPGSPNVVRFVIDPEVQDEVWWDIRTQAQGLAAGTGVPIASQSLGPQDSLARLSAFMGRVAWTQDEACR